MSQSETRPSENPPANALPPKTLPLSLRAWAERTLGPLGDVHDASHPRQNSRVWDVTDSRGHRFFVKQSPTAKFYERETFGYQSAAPALGFGRAPRLVARDARDLALLLTAVPGTPVSRLTLAPLEHRAAHRQFGALLRCLHGSDKMPTAGRRAAEAAIERAATTDTEKYLGRAGDLLTDRRRALVRRAADHLLHLTDRLAPAHIHGDAQERNALWSGPPGSGRLAVIDFERSRYAPAVQDFARLACGPWQDRPDLRAAFFHGYGRALTDAEGQALRCLAALDAASCLAYGPAHGDDEVTARGTRTLDRLERGIFV